MRLGKLSEEIRSITNREEYINKVVECEEMGFGKIVDVTITNVTIVFEDHPNKLVIIAKTELEKQ